MLGVEEQMAGDGGRCSCQEFPREPWWKEQESLVQSEGGGTGGWELRLWSNKEIRTTATKGQAHLVIPKEPSLEPSS